MPETLPAPEILLPPMCPDAAGAARLLLSQGLAQEIFVPQRLDMQRFGQLRLQAGCLHSGRLGDGTSLLRPFFHEAANLLQLDPPGAGRLALARLSASAKKRKNIQHKKPFRPTSRRLLPT